MPDVSLDFNLTNGTTADASQVMANLNEMVAALNALDEENLAAALAEKLGVSQAGAVRRGKSIIATEEARTNAAYGLLTTPDQVQNVVLPTDGLLVVDYSALWKESVNGAARAAIFIGANQLQARYGSNGSGAQEAGIGTGFVGGTPTDTYADVFSCPIGLLSLEPTAGPAAPPTTGHALGIMGAGNTWVGYVGGNATNHADLIAGGALRVFAAAGTYTVSVQFKASSGSVTVKERKLWVETRGF